MHTRSILGAVLVSMLAGCAGMHGLAPRDRPAQAADLHATESLADARLAQAAWPASDWWRDFADPQLDRLEAEALAGSPSLKIAQARLQNAQARAGIAASALSPQLDASASGTRLRFSEHDIAPEPLAGSWQTQSRLALDFGWELDFWGRNQAALDAALGRVQAAEVDAFAARLVLSVAVARGYVQLARLYDQLDVAATTLAQQQQIYELTRQREDFGLDARVELKQAEAALPSTRERIRGAGRSARDHAQPAGRVAGQGAGSRPCDHAPEARGRRRAGAAVAPGRRPAGAPPRRGREPLAGRSGRQGHRRREGALLPRRQPARLRRASKHRPGRARARRQRRRRRRRGDPPAAVRRRTAAQPAGRRRRRLRHRRRALQPDSGGGAARHRRPAGRHSFGGRAERAARLAIAAASEAYELSLLRYRDGVGTYLTVLSAHAQVLLQQRLQVDLRAREFDNRIDLIRALGGGFEDRAGTAASAAGTAHPRNAS